MAAETTSQARSLVWHGAMLVLLGLISGFTTLFAKVPATALSAHTIGVLQGAVLFGLAGAWHLIRGSALTLRIAKYTIVIGFYANWLGVQLAAFWSAGRSMFSVSGANMPEGAAGWMNILVMFLLNVSMLVMVTCVIILWCSRKSRGVTTGNVPSGER